MIRSSKGKGTTETKQEDEPDTTKKSAAAIAATSSSSRQWSAFRNPRIVRVSRSFGGKDRHSKVCTVRGLRDRRIRLSLPTAIQLYDLQDRLGLTQPSKVIDWLLDNTKDDIDNLPPLQMPQGFNQFHPQFSPPISPFFDMNLHHHNLVIKMNTSSSLDAEEGSFSGKGKLVSTNEEQEEEDRNQLSFGKGKLVSTNEEQEEEDRNQLSLSAAKLFPLAASNSSMPSFFNINNPPNVQLNPYNYQWDASNLSLSQFGMLPQNNSISLNSNNVNSSTVSLPPPSSLAGGSQFFYCPPATLPSFFPQFPPPFANLENNETREISHFQLLNSGFGNSQRNSGARQGHKDQNADR